MLAAVSTNCSFSKLSAVGEVVVAVVVDFAVFVMVAVAVANWSCR